MAVWFSREGAWTLRPGCRARRPQGTTGVEEQQTLTLTNTTDGFVSYKVLPARELGPEGGEGLEAKQRLPILSPMG